MNHGLQLVLWSRGLQGHIWLKGQRANKLFSQITFSNCKSNAHILSKDVIFIAPGPGVLFLFLLRFTQILGRQRQRQLTAVLVSATSREYLTNSQTECTNLWLTTYSMNTFYKQSLDCYVFSMLWICSYCVKKSGNLFESDMAKIWFNVNII